MVQLPLPLLLLVLAAAGGSVQAGFVGMDASGRTVVFADARVGGELSVAGNATVGGSELRVGGAFRAPEATAQVPQVRAVGGATPAARVAVRGELRSVGSVAGQVAARLSPVMPAGGAVVPPSLPAALGVPTACTPGTLVFVAALGRVALCPAGGAAWRVAGTAPGLGARAALPTPLGAQLGLSAGLPVHASAFPAAGGSGCRGLRDAVAAAGGAGALPGPATDVRYVVRAGSARGSGVAVPLRCDWSGNGGGAWTLVMRAAGAAGDSVAVVVQANETGEQGSLATMAVSGGQGKLADADIADFVAPSSRGSLLAAYRLTDETATTEYFVPGSCTYAHVPGGGSATACRQFSVAPGNETAAPSAYRQCAAWGDLGTDGPGGIDLWFGCNSTSVATNVAITHRFVQSPFVNHTADIVSNPTGAPLGTTNTTAYANNVLLWVK